MADNHYKLLSYHVTQREGIWLGSRSDRYAVACDRDSPYPHLSYRKSAFLAKIGGAPTPEKREDGLETMS